MREEIEKYMSARLCPDCRGARLKPEALEVTVGGRNVVQVTQLAIAKAQRFFQDLEANDVKTSVAATITSADSASEKDSSQNGIWLVDPLARISSDEPLVLCTLSARERIIARQILKEIRARLQFLIDVGLDYLTVD